MDILIVMVLAVPIIISTIGLVMSFVLSE